MIDPQAIPDAALLFEPTIDAYGRRLALVFGNEHHGGSCPFYLKQCTHCDIGAGEGVQFNAGLNQQRLAFFQQHYAEVLPEVAHLVIYNSGSTLNPRELSRDSLRAILGYAASLATCAVVSLDSREMYITENNLRFVLDHLRADQQARVVLGIESQSDAIRLGALNKLMSRSAIERACAVLGSYGKQVGLDINIVFQPPEVTGAAAIDEAIATVAYGLELAARYQIPVDFNFHPYYPSLRSKQQFPAHPRASLEDALIALEAMQRIIAASADRTQIFVGWHDEMHDQEPDLREAEVSRFKQRIPLIVSSR
jgi:hypothetical protein